MVTVTDLVLGQAVFGRPRKFGEQDFGSNAAGGFQGAMPDPSWRQAYSDAKRAALIDALENGGSSDSDGSASTPDVGSPMVTGGQTTQDSLYQRRPYGLPPPPRPQRPFSEDYPSSYFNPLPWRYLRRAPTDAQGRLLYDSERRGLGANYVAGRRYKDGPDVGLQHPEVMDVLNQLGHAPRFVPTNQMSSDNSSSPAPTGRTFVQSRAWPRSWLYGRYRPGQVSIDDNLDPRSEYITASHELGHVLRLLTELSLNDDGRREMRALFNTMNNPNRTPDGLDAAPGSIATPETLGRYSTKSNIPGLNPVEEEYFAEAFRAYITDPNFVKSVAPNFAAAVRAAVNSHPRLRRVIQFNSLKFPTYAGLGRSSDQSETATG